MLKFNVGQVYSTRSACDYDCIFSYIVVKRTDKSIWIQDIRNGKPTGEIERKKIQNYYSDAESVSLGNYSMAPIITAKDPDLGSKEKSQINKEYQELLSQWNEYILLCRQIKITFTGEACQVRLESLAHEYGAELLEKRIQRLKTKLTA